MPGRLSTERKNNQNCQLAVRVPAIYEAQDRALKTARRQEGARDHAAPPRADRNLRQGEARRGESRGRGASTQRRRRGRRRRGGPRHAVPGGRRGADGGAGRPAVRAHAAAAARAPHALLHRGHPGPRPRRPAAPRPARPAAAAAADPAVAQLLLHQPGGPVPDARLRADPRAPGLLPPPRRLLRRRRLRRAPLLLPAGRRRLRARPAAAGPPGEAPALEPLHPAAAAQEEGGPGPLLQRPDHRAGEEVRDAEIPLAAREKAPRQDAAAQRAAGQNVVSESQGQMEASKAGKPPGPQKGGSRRRRRPLRAAARGLRQPRAQGPAGLPRRRAARPLARLAGGAGVRRLRRLRPGGGHRRRQRLLHPRALMADPGSACTLPGAGFGEDFVAGENVHRSPESKAKQTRFITSRERETSFSQTVHFFWQISSLVKGADPCLYLICKIYLYIN